MTRYLSTIYKLLSILILTALASCNDELLYDPAEGDFEGTANLRLTFAFTPMEVAEPGARSATDAIENINDLSVLIYDTSGSLIPGGYYYLHRTADFTVDKVNATQNVVGGTATTVKTCRATVSEPINVPRGKYRIYAVANMGDMRDDYSEEILEESKMRTIQLEWQSGNIGANSQMSGWFHKEEPTTTHTDDEDKYPSANSNGIINVPVITVTSDMTLHAWLRRAAAKITVAYDASELDDDIWIYLRSVTIRNLPAECSLVANNAVTPPDEAPGADTAETDRSSDVVEGEMYFYSGETAESYAGKEDDYTGYLSWPLILANGNPHIGVHVPTVHENGSVENPVALYSYENLQGDGESKRQKMKDEDPYDLVYTYRDNKSAGTFIEVDAYYVSNAENNEGSGPIKYRFMLGKDILKNYDLERNFHYKLTLVFHGTANNIDWHIEYREEEKPGVYAPDPYYVSYLYNSEMEYPIRVEGNITSSYIDVTIDRNDWRPWDEETGSYPPEEVGDWQWYGNDNAQYPIRGENQSASDTDPAWNGPEGTAMWNGFLSLYDTSKRTEVFKNATDDNDYNIKDWYKISNDVYSEYTGSGYDAESYSDRSVTVKLLSTNTEVTSNKDEGYRRYKVPEADGTYEYYTVDGATGAANGFGKYRVVKKGNVTTFYVPLYTRPLFLNTWTSYTGNNPFFSYMRRARLSISVEIDNQKLTRKKTVYQVRRQINPKVIMRRHDNDNCFTVELTHRMGESRDHIFESFNSRGPWSAHIVLGEGWEIVGRSSGKTESPIRFTVRPKGKIQPHETRCAVVEIWYHSRSCRHLVYLRQGYAPIDMEASRAAKPEQGVTAITDNVLWHSFNLWWVDGTTPRETDCPIEDGSFFRIANYTQAIDPINNNYNFNAAISDFNKGPRYTSNGSARNVTNAKDGYYWLSPVTRNNLAKWDEITANTTSAFSTLSLYGATVKPPSLDDWSCFVDNDNIELGFGIAYADGASGMQFEPDNAFRHSYVCKMDSTNAATYHLEPFNIVGKDTKGEFGVRANCVINKRTGAVLVFPLGHSGYGHRCNRFAYSSGNKDQYGALRYAQRDALFPQKATVNARPLLYTIYSNYGAVYWTDCAISTHTGWDINYTTFDFNSYGSNGTRDGCFIRLVQPKSNTPSASNPYWDYNKSLMTTNPGY